MEVEVRSICVEARLAQTEGRGMLGDKVGNMRYLENV